MCKSSTDTGGPRRCSGDSRAAYQRASATVRDLQRAEQEALDYLRLLPADDTTVDVPDAAAPQGPQPVSEGRAGGVGEYVGAGRRPQTRQQGPDRQLCEHLESELGLAFTVEGTGADRRFVGNLPNGCQVQLKPYTDDPHPTGVGWAAQVHGPGDDPSRPMGWAADEQLAITDRAAVTRLVQEALTGAAGAAVSRFGVGLSAVRRG